MPDRFWILVHYFFWGGCFIVRIKRRKKQDKIVKD